MTARARRRVRLGPVTAVLLLAVTSAGAARSAPATAASQMAVPPSQALAVLFRPQEAMSRPSRHSVPLSLVRALRPITGERTVLPVLGRTTSAGIRWLHVRLPGRPNGHAGWIEQRGSLRSSTGWHIVVDTSRRRVTVYKRAHIVHFFSAVVGKPSTPTPRGTFFVEESIKLGPGDVGAPFALALSARSNVLQEFEGGPGQIALHGLENVGGVLGTAVSHGCVRLANATMRWLSARIGPGVPVTITG